MAQAKAEASGRGPGRGESVPPGHCAMGAKLVCEVEGCRPEDCQSIEPCFSLQRPETEQYGPVEAMHEDVVFPTCMDCSRGREACGSNSKGGGQAWPRAVTRQAVPLCVKGAEADLEAGRRELESWLQAVLGHECREAPWAQADKDGWPIAELARSEKAALAAAALLPSSAPLLPPPRAPSGPLPPAPTAPMSAQAAPPAAAEEAEPLVLAEESEVPALAEKAPIACEPLRPPAEEPPTAAQTAVAPDTPSEATPESVATAAAPEATPEAPAWACPASTPTGGRVVEVGSWQSEDDCEAAAAAAVHCALAAGAAAPRGEAAPAKTPPADGEGEQAEAPAAVAESRAGEEPQPAVAAEDGEGLEAAPTTDEPVRPQEVYGLSLYHISSVSPLRSRPAQRAWSPPRPRGSKANELLLW
uniref:Uncharacterized protein n=1 Tax=Alexandrium monilatum TaxID=311494 RepID=A0A7S4UZD4_9DINO